MKNNKKNEGVAKGGVGIVPLGDNVLLKLIEKSATEEKNKFGIIVPNGGNDSLAPLEGVVVAVHAIKMDDKNQPIALTVKVGDTVLFPRHLKDESVVIDGITYVFIGEYNLLGIVK